MICYRRNAEKLMSKVYETVVRAAMMYSLGTVAVFNRQTAELEVEEM